MSTPPDVLAAEGTVSQLPRGAATQLNDQAEQGRALAEAAPTAEAPAEVEIQPAQAADYEPQFEASTDDEVFITGPTTRPDEDVTTGTAPQPRVPAHVRKQLPALQVAAQAPGASAELQALVSYLLRNS